MIELSLTTAIMLYLSLTLSVTLGIWGYHHYRSRTKKIDLSQNQLIVCEYCRNPYLNPKEKSVSQCLKCGSFNQKP